MPAWSYRHRRTANSANRASGQRAAQPSAQRTPALRAKGQQVAQKLKAAKLAISRWAGEQMQPARAGATGGGPDVPVPAERKGLAQHFRVAEDEFAAQRQRKSNPPDEGASAAHAGSETQQLGDAHTPIKKARQAPDALDATASVSDPAVRRALSRRLGARVELDPDIGTGIVVRQNDADPDTIIVRAGPDANPDHVLAQRNKIDALKKHTTNHAAQTKQRIDEPVKGLYEKIDPDTVPEGWHVEDKVTPRSKGRIEIRTQIVAPNGAVGRLRRVYDPSTDTLNMEAAFFDKDLPRWVSSDNPMHPDRGTPTFAYMQMRQMRKLGIARSGLKTVHMSTIVNERTILELAQARKSHPELNEAIRKTHSVQYAETAMIQSGHRIRKVTVTGGDELDARSTLTRRSGPSADATKKANDELLAAYGLTEDDKVLWGFDIDIDLMPWQ